MYRNEIEKLFIEDCRDKKRTASGAYHRASRGVAPVRVHNQSDNMTKKELKEMSGEVISFMQKPMVWADFKDMPIKAQKSYYMWLKDEFEVLDKYIVAMLGVDSGNFSNYKKTWLDIERKPGKRSMGSCQLARWNRFVQGENPDEIEKKVEEKPVVKVMRSLSIESDSIDEIIDSLKNAMPLMTEGHYYVSVSVFPQNEMGVAYCGQISE